MATEYDESNLEVKDEETLVEETTVCAGDGTTCVECGKVFTHSFYFSHISTHASHKGFVVVGQCTFCGLVFSDELIFNAHMISSQEKQVQLMAEDDVSTELIDPDAGSELSSQSNPHFEDYNFEAHQDHVDVPDKEDIPTADENMAISNPGKEDIPTEDENMAISNPDKEDISTADENMAISNSDKEVISTADENMAISNPDKEDISTADENMAISNPDKEDISTADENMAISNPDKEDISTADENMAISNPDKEDIPTADENMVISNSDKEDIPTADENMAISNPDKEDITTADENMAISNVHSSTLNKEKPQLKRKAPEEFDLDPSQPSTSSTTDSDVEAHMASSAQSGLADDPEAVSNHSNIKKHIKLGDIDLGQDSTWIECVRDSDSDDDLPKEVSQEHVYLDIDDSPVDDLELLLEKLEQSKDKLGQIKEKNMAAEINTSPQVSLNSERAKGTQKQNISLAGDGFARRSITNEVPLTKLAVRATGAKGSLPNLSPRIIGHHNSYPSRMAFSPSFGDQSKTWHASNFGKTNTIRSPQASQMRFNSFIPSHLPQRFIPSHLSQSYKINTPRAPSVPQYVNRNTQHNGSFTPPVSNRSNVYRSQAEVISNHGHNIVNYQQGQVREKNGNMTRSVGNTNVQKSNSLEELKKDSRENVVEMLQSIGMIALTSTSLAQGKIFSKQKSKAGLTSLPPNKKVDMTAGFNTTSHSRGGFQNRLLGSNKILTSQQTQGKRNQLTFEYDPFVNRNQFSSYGFQNNSYLNPRSLMSSSNFTGLRPRGTGYGRGGIPTVGRGQHMNVNMRGAVSSTPVKGRIKPITNPNNSSGLFRGHGVTNTISKQARSSHTSNEIIIIDDEDDDVEIVCVDETNKTAPVLGKTELEHTAQLEPKISTDLKIDQEKSDNVDDNLACSVSDIMTSLDKTHGSPTAPVMEIDGSLILEKPSCEDECVDNAKIKAEVENDQPQSDLTKQRRSSSDSITTVCFKTEKENDLRDNKTDSEDGNDSDNGLNDHVDILPGEDIDGWKVCLAEDTDTDDDCSPSGTHKLSHRHLPSQENKQDHNPSSFIETNQEGLKDDDTLSHHSCQNLASEKPDKSSSPQTETSPDSPQELICSSQHQNLANPQELICSSQHQNLASPQELICSSQHENLASPQELICSSQHENLASPRQDDSLLLLEALNNIESNFIDSCTQENMNTCSDADDNINTCSDVDDNNREDNSSEIMCSEREDKNCTREVSVEQNNLVSDCSSNLPLVGPG